MLHPPTKKSATLANKSGYLNLPQLTARLILDQSNRLSNAHGVFVLPGRNNGGLAVTGRHIIDFSWAFGIFDPSPRTRSCDRAFSSLADCFLFDLLRC